MDGQTPFERKSRRDGYMISTVIHALIIILALLPWPHKEQPDPEQGILVNLGLPDQGQGEENTPGPPAPMPDPEPEKPKPVDPEPVIPKPKPTPTKPSTPVKEKPVVTTEDPNAVAIREQKERDRKAREEADKRAREEEDARRAREDEKRRKDAEAQATKDQIGGLFGGGGKGKGKGNTGTPGNQGDPNGDPNSKVLDGITTGTGSIGGSLTTRNVLNAPKITDNSSLEGTVVVAVCVGSDGSVVSADFTQRGSTTSNATLVNLAESNARKWKFNTGDADKQCGTITYRFKVQ
jgi:outer membrane biosynthesis protein TonB